VLRPQPARWFEILVARDDAAILLEALARSGAAELEPQSASAQRAAPSVELAPALEELAQAQRRYAPYWPAAASPSRPGAPPAATLARCLEVVRAWSREAEPIVHEMQRNARERAEAALWRDLLDRANDAALDLSALAEAGPLLEARLLVFPAAGSPQMPPGVLARSFEIEGRLHMLALGARREMDRLCREAAAAKAQIHDIPRWLRGSAREGAHAAARRLAALEDESRQLAARLEALNARHELQCVLGEANLLQWFSRHAPAVESGEWLARVTGWTSDRTALVQAIERSGARAAVRFPAAPPGLAPPILLRNPWWARPFELFSRALGMPARDEADPTRLLAVAVPLLFGYMFGDVGQGLVLAAGGAVLARRHEIGRLLVAGGLSAAAFGFVFGSVFGIEGLLAPLWVAPLEEPLVVIGVPLVGGAVLLTIGLALNALEAYWRGQLRAWLWAEAGLLAVYLGLLFAAVQRAALGLAVAGVLWHIAGSVRLARRAAAAVTGLLGLLEKTAQLLINTLSFARVGAFALAHAGLGAALVALAEASGGRFAAVLILVVGNALVIALEGLVVSVQTTRLVLFEFFIRFLAGRGRVFRPLPPPPLTFRET
jgi:V/A-type H+-transporting ATPase subunit I